MRKTAKNTLLGSCCFLIVSALMVQVENAAAADTLRPTVSFSAPADGSTLAGIVIVKVLASDNVKVANVKLYLGYSELIGTDSNAPYEYSLDTNKYSNGQYFLKALATDTSGNTRLSKVYVTFNNPIPLSTGQWNLGVYPIKSNSDVQSVIAEHDVSLIGNFRLPVLQKYPDEQTILLAQSHDAIREGINQIAQSGVSVEYIAYDNERSNYALSTPESELVDPALSTNQAMDMIHDAGFKSAVCPTRAILKEELLGVQWSKVDIIVLQMQKVVGTAEFFDLTTRVAQVARPQNPDILIIVQVAPSLYSNAEIIESVKKVEQYVDGVSVMWNMDDEAVLDDLLTRLENM